MRGLKTNKNLRERTGERCEEEIKFEKFVGVIIIKARIKFD